MPPPPLVSIIVPNYNHARYLPARLASIRGQSFTDYELIFLDDASSDQSMEVAESLLRDMDAQVVLNEANSGSPFVQWNRGVRLAKGQFIWIAESDDDAEPELLETLMKLLADETSLSLAYCQSRIIDEHGKEGPLLMPPGRWSSDFVMDSQESLRSEMLFANRVPNASAVLFRRDAYFAVGGANESMRLCGDWAAWNRLLTRGGMAYSARPLNRFRTHGGSVRSSTMKSEVYISERYRLAIDMRELFEHDARLHRRIARAAAMDWAATMISPKGLLSIQANRRIATIARNYDRFALARALSLLPVRMKHAIRNRLCHRR